MTTSPDQSATSSSETKSDLTPLEQLARFAVRCRDGQIAEAVLPDVADRIVDIVGIQLAARTLQTSAAATAFALEQGGPAQAHIVGEPTAISAIWAAFGNGVLAHSLDYDDTHLPSIIHPSASVIPAAMSVAEAVGASAYDMMRAVAAGIEVTVRVGQSGYDASNRANVWFDNGQHATSICGTIGSACASAMVLGLDEVGIANAMAVSASMSAGIIEANRTGGTVKRLHCGWAAHAGVSAALLVARGFTGPLTALEGRFGLFQAFLRDDVDHGAIPAGLGSTWLLRDVFFKPYPANHYTHAGVDAARRLRERGVRPGDIESVQIGVAEATLRTIGEPIEIKRAPQTSYQAQFSAPYTFTAALFGGGGLGVSLSDFDEVHLRDPERLELMSRITVVADARCESIYPMQFPAVVRVWLRDGQELVEDVLVNRGGPQDPLTHEQLMAKFDENAASALAAGGIEAVHVALDRLAHGEAGVAELMAATLPS
jgi:2-methylcitrate dehydratase PrpD